MTEKENTILVSGKEIYPEHRKINPETGQQQDYVVLSKEELDKGFVKPYRITYIHIGAPIFTNVLRELTIEENKQYEKYDYVKFEEYSKNEASKLGRFWTQEQLNTIGKGCRTTTTISKPIAETYARDPKFYSGTFCCGCKKHFPVNEFQWFGTSELVGS